MAASSLSSNGGRPISLGVAEPIQSAERCDVFLEDIRVQYPEATHYVYAWRDVIALYRLQRFSDDGDRRAPQVDKC